MYIVLNSISVIVKSLRKCRIVQDQDQRSEPEAESQVQSTSDDVLHAVSIPAYETHRWKEDSCSPNLDGDIAQGANKI